MSPYGGGGYGGSEAPLGTAGEDGKDTDETAMDLDRGRNDPPPNEIWSGKALNELLRSIQAHKLNRAASPALDEDILKQINLTDGTSSGNVGMLRDGGNLDWPEFLKESPFDKARTRLARNLRIAVGQLQHKEPLEPGQLQDINADFKELDKKFSGRARELSPVTYIKTADFLNPLGSALEALSAPKVANYFNGTWSAKGKNVAELVAHLSKEGLTFGVAAPGEEAAYNALYLALAQLRGQLAGRKEVISSSGQHLFQAGLPLGGKAGLFQRGRTARSKTPHLPSRTGSTAILFRETLFFVFRD